MAKTLECVDLELVLRAQDGDEFAAEEIVDRLQKPLTGFLFRTLGPRFSSQFDDIQQDVLAKVFITIERFDVDRGVKFTTWVLTYARNHCIDLLKKRRLPIIDRDMSDELLSVADTRAMRPLRSLELLEIHEHIDAAINSISPRHRDVFVLRESGMKYSEIAKQLGVGENTIKSRLHKARKSLRKKLSYFDLDRTVA
jgi:RNA polymerase sigma-70 factor (ECF subfamily)